MKGGTLLSATTNSAKLEVRHFGVLRHARRGLWRYSERRQTRQEPVENGATASPLPSAAEPARPEVVARPESPPPEPVRHEPPPRQEAAAKTMAYGIEQAILLMRTIPVEQNVDLVVRVIKQTLESMQNPIKQDIIHWLPRARSRLSATRCRKLQTAISNFEARRDTGSARRNLPARDRPKRDNQRQGSPDARGEAGRQACREGRGKAGREAGGEATRDDVALLRRGTNGANRWRAAHSGNVEHFDSSADNASSLEPFNSHVVWAVTEGVDPLEYRITHVNAPRPPGTA